MRRNSRLVALYFLVVALIAPLGMTQLVSAQDDPMVTTVFDGTSIGGCELSLSQDGGDFVPIACPAGSVIYVVTLPQSEAEAAGYTNYFMTDDRQDPSVVAAADSLAPSSMGIAACQSSGHQTLNGSYRSDPGNEGSRVHYTLDWDQSVCSVLNPVDSAYSSGASVQISWTYSMMAGQYLNRGYDITNSGAGPAYLPGAASGDRYEHHATCGSLSCYPYVDAFGYWVFD